MAEAVGGPKAPEIQFKEVKGTQLKVLTADLQRRMQLLPPEQTYADDALRAQEINFLNTAVVENNARGWKGKRKIDVNDPDKLWVITNTLFPQQDADVAYLTVRFAQLGALEADINPDINAERLHQVSVGLGDKAVNYLNNRQMVYGDNSALRLLAEVVGDHARPEQSRFSRRGFLKLMGLGAAGIGIFELGRLDQVLESVVGRSTPKVETGAKLASPEPAHKAAKSFNELIKPIIDQVEKRRQQRRIEGSDKSVEAVMNSRLINVGLAAFSEGRGESLTVLSYNKDTGQVTTVSLTRETITPEVIKFNQEKDRKEGKQRKDKYSLASASNMVLYHTGGFGLMRKVIEDETGLESDLQFYMDEMFLHDLIKDVLGDKVEIDVKEDLELVDFDFDKRWGYDPNGFVVEKGKHTMNSKEAMRFILANNQEVKKGKYGQPGGRKNILVMACFNAAMDKLRKDPLDTFKNLSFFLLAQKIKGRIDADFDLKSIGELAKGLSGQGLDFKLPEVTENDLMVNDEFFGDGGLMRVHRFVGPDGRPTPEYYQAHPNMQKLVDKTIAMIPILKAEGLQNVDDAEKGLPARGVLPLLAQVPIGADPEATDLVTGYYGSTRKLVKDRLMV